MPHVSHAPRITLIAMIDIDEITRRVPLFADLDPDDLRFVLRVARRLEFAKGALMVRQGQIADSALVMESGSASVVSVLPGGGEAVMAEGAAWDGSRFGSERFSSAGAGDGESGVAASGG